MLLYTELEYGILEKPGKIGQFRGLPSRRTENPKLLS